MINNDIYDNLRDVPRDKKIAIWGLRRKSFDILTYTINARIKVQYFVDDVNRFDKSDMIFDKMIVGKEDIGNDKEIFIIVTSNDYSKNEKWIEEHFSERFYVIEVGRITKKIRESERIYIYGAGDAGRRTLEVLKSQDIEIDGFIDSNDNKIKNGWCGHPVYSRDILCKSDTVIVSTVYYNEICEELLKSHDISKVFVDYRNSRTSTRPLYFKDMNTIFLEYNKGPLVDLNNARVFYTNVLNDFKNKGIILYGQNEIAIQLVEILGLLGIKVEYIVDDDICKRTVYCGRIQVRDVLEISSDDMDDKLVIITKLEKEQVSQSKEKLERINFKNYSQYREVKLLDQAYRKIKIDKLLYSVALYTHSQPDKLGFYFCKNKGKKKVCILGNSTSVVPLYENTVKSWPEFLSDKYDDVTVISAASGGFESTRELFKLIRDIRQFDPVLVISYSGINDVLQPKKEDNIFVLQSTVNDKDDGIWYGIENRMGTADFWILMECYMKAICEVNGYDFISILQPAFSLRNESDLSFEEKVLMAIWGGDRFMTRYPEFTKEVKHRMDEFSWMYDMTNVFDGVSGQVFRDRYHLTDYGNKIIAENVYRIIREYYVKREVIFDQINH